MTHDNTSPATPYWVDLTREEYVRYSLQMARAFGPMRSRTVQLISSLVCCGALAALTIYDMYLFGKPDWLLIGLSVALAVLAIGFWLYVPHRLRSRAAVEYDRMIECGYNYCGELQISDTEITKIGEELTTRVRLDGHAMFIESADSLVFIGSEQRAIVLPARCLTKEIADRLRQAADRLPPASRRFFGRICPQGQVVLPAAPTTQTVLWEQTIHYNPQETLDILKARTRQQFWTRLPHFAVMSTVLALMFGWSETSIWPCVLIFLGSLALLTVFNLVIPLFRLQKMQRMGYAPTPTSALQVKLTDRGVRMLEGDRFACAPWSQIEHVYDRGEYAEMLWKQHFLRIPKRCITDIGEFDTIITRCRNNKQ